MNSNEPRSVQIELNQNDDHANWSQKPENKSSKGKPHQRDSEDLEQLKKDIARLKSGKDSEGSSVYLEVATPGLGKDSPTGWPETWPLPPKSESQANPKEVPKKCDLVLKGGITSGVVYPLAICEVATKFQLKQLGGTSAGAIAAALAAAAERGRHVLGAGFERLAAIPDKLVETKTEILPNGTRLKTYGRTKLMRLFQPHPRLQLLFRSLLRLMNLSSFWQLPKTQNKFLATIYGVMKLEMVFTSVFTLLGSWVFEYVDRYKIYAIICLFLSSALVIVVPLELLATVVWVPLAAALVTLAWIAYSFFKIMPNQRFGMCGGTSTSEHDGQGLTDWLHDELNLAAHGTARARPLTFGELWYGPDTNDTRGPAHTYIQSPAPPFVNVEDRYVDLNLLTTCASHGRSYKLPLGNVTLQLYFDPSDMRRLVPQTVVNWMVNHSPQRLRATTGVHNLYAMPPMTDWPVVFK